MTLNSEPLGFVGMINLFFTYETTHGQVQSQKLDHTESDCHFLDVFSHAFNNYNLQHKKAKYIRAELHTKFY